MIMFDPNTTKTYMLEMFIPLLQYFYMTIEHINLLFEVWEIIPRLKAWSASTRLHSNNSVLSRHSVSVCSKADLKHSGFLPMPPKHWEYRHVSPSSK